MTTTTRRHLLAGAAAVPLAAMLPALPSVAAEALQPAHQVDRAKFAERLCHWAFHVPEMGERIDAMLADVDHVLSTSEGTGMLLDARKVCEERSGRAVSFDWLCGHDTYPGGEPCPMFLREPKPEQSADENRLRLVYALDGLTPRQQGHMLEIMRAMNADDWRGVRRLQAAYFADSGIAVEAW